MDTDDATGRPEPASACLRLESQTPEKHARAGRTIYDVRPSQYIAGGPDVLPSSPLKLSVLSTGHLY